MKNKIITTLILVITTSLSYAQTETAIQFNHKKIDIGVINSNKEQIVNAVFEFVNDNETPISILTVDVSCPCLEAVYSKVPIKKGERGIITLKVDTK